MMRGNFFPLALLVILTCGATASAEDKVLYQKQSRYNNIQVTEDDQGLRVLLFEQGTVRQSAAKPWDPDHLEFHYARAMPAGLAFVDNPQRMLMIGLGGGTIPRFLHKHFPRMMIDVVDIDPDVVDVAKRFFGFREDATLRAHVADGRRFIEACREPYDVIFLDAFGSDNIPRHLTTREFLQAVRKAVSPEGAVVGNVWGPSSNLLYDSMVRTYQDVFDELYIIDVRGADNKILVALPRKQRIDRDKLARRARRISQEKGFRHDLGEIVLRGFRRPGEELLRGRVLTDEKTDKKAG